MEVWIKFLPPCILLWSLELLREGWPAAATVICARLQGALWPPAGSPGLRLRKAQFCPGSATYICVPSTDTQPPCALLSPTWNTCPSNLVGKLWHENISKDWQVLQTGWTNRLLISQNNSCVAFLSHQSKSRKKRDPGGISPRKEE